MPENFQNNAAEFEQRRGRFSLINSRLEFINAIARNVPSTFRDLHELPKEAYIHSGLVALSPKKRADFWKYCFAGKDLSFYLDGLAAMQHDFSAPHIHRDPNLAPKKEIKGGDRSWLWQNIHLFLRDFGVNVGKAGEVTGFEQGRFPQIVEFFSVLEKWAASYHIGEGWLLHWAFLKIDSFVCRNEAHSGDTTFRHFELPDIFGDEILPPIIDKSRLPDWGLWDWQFDPFVFERQGWRAFFVDRKTFEERLREDFEKEMKRYADDCESYLDLRMDVVRRKKKFAIEHYDWLARHQCGGESYNRIAKSCNATSEAVRQGVRSTARSIDLNLHRVPTGRPPGSKSRALTQRVIKK